MKGVCVRSIIAAATAAAFLVGCGHTMAGGNAMAAPRAASAMTPAAGLRTSLNALLSEHVVLAAAATGAALDGRSAEFPAAAAALDANSTAIAQAMGSVYGRDAEQAFLPCGASTSASPSTTPPAWPPATR
jgi:hypothetical protein